VKDEIITYTKWEHEVRKIGSSMSILGSSTSSSACNFSADLYIDVTYIPVFKLNELGWYNPVYECSPGLSKRCDDF
jgi:hypothetical protein